jgi:S1-C subfamily serine protease
MQDRFLARLFWLTLASALLILLWRGLPDIEGWFAPEKSPPRVVTARGDLAADEKATVELFERARGSVVFITTKSEVRDFWTRNVFTVPRGTGSGFIWGRRGPRHHQLPRHREGQRGHGEVGRWPGTTGRPWWAPRPPTTSPCCASAWASSGRRRCPWAPATTSRWARRCSPSAIPSAWTGPLTTGIVSALDRSLGGQGGNGVVTIEHLIQTDAAINPGNSGGPLLDSAGRLIGINTAIYSPSGASAGIGFSVPVDTVNKVVPELIRDGKYLRPALGIEVDEGLNRRLTEMLEVEGVVILRVAPGSAAATAGLKGATIARDGGIVPGDIITAVGGKPVDGAGKLIATLDDFKVGDTIKVTVLREGKKVDVPVTLQPGV